jgi:hypothetical protein
MQLPDANQSYYKISTMQFIYRIEVTEIGRELAKRLNAETNIIESCIKALSRKNTD